MDLNPYNNYNLSRNPYHSLPKGFFLYTSCYPIDKTSRIDDDATCSKFSTGVNIRIYKMTDAAFLLEKINNNAEFKKFDAWREIALYEYIRDHILRKHVSSHFPLLYGYHMPISSGIDFKNIGNIQEQDTYIYNSQLLNFSNAPINNNNEYTGKVLLAMTESYTHSLFAWASTIYAVDGNVNRMINTGYHNEKVWTSIIFQIMAALCVMQEHNIAIKNFSIDKNVFIKDLKRSGDVNTYWKYIIKGIEYFIPNHGYLVIIDSNYRDKFAATQNAAGTILSRGASTASTVSTASTASTPVILNTGLWEGLLIPPISAPVEQPITYEDEEHKIVAKFLDDNEADIKNSAYTSFRNCINPNVFRQDFINNGGMTLPQNVMTLLDDINKDTELDTSPNNGRIFDYIEKYMTSFMHNRVGTLLQDSEKSNVRPSNGNDFKKGEICVYEGDYGTDKYCIYIDNNGSATNGTLPKCYILTRQNDNSQIEKIQVPRSSLKKYIAPTSTIQQTYKANEANVSTEPLEVYIVQ